MKNITLIILLFASVSLTAQNNDADTINIIDANGDKQELPGEFLEGKNELKQLKEAVLTDAEVIDKLKVEVKELKQTKSILLIVVGLLLIAFAIFFPKLIKKA